MRARDSRTVSSCARSSAWSLAFTRARRAAATTPSTSIGSSRSVGSWTSTASGSPSYSIGVTARCGPSSGTGKLTPAASTYSPRSGSQNATSSDWSSESFRELAPDLVHRRALEMDDELADMDAREASTQEPGEERERQRRETDHLPPVEVVEEP